MKHLCLSILVIFSLAYAVGVRGQILRAATWNVENLFDTIHDAGKDDYEFLPQAERQWNAPRYWRKLRNIAQTLAAMELPELVALQEVENDSVLRDLTRRTQLWPIKYRYITTDCPDARGIDVALLYRPESFTLLSWRSARVPSAEYGLPPTRDILVATGIAAQDTLHVCVVHMPSRRSTGSASKRNRQLAMQTLCNVMDSLREEKVIVLGDFNAEPRDESLAVLSPHLHTLMPTDAKTLRGPRGTYYFRGVWGFLDHIFVSPALLPHVQGQAEECRFSWLLRTSKKIPHRTYGGTSYLGGISDHLPLVISLLPTPE